MPSFFEWRFVVETSKDGGKNWAYNEAPFDDMDQAIAHAKTLTPPVRVKQFKVTRYVVERDNDQPVTVTVASSDGQPVPMVPWFCVSHPTEKANALETSDPRCPTCGQSMFKGDGTEEIRDL